MFEALHGYTSDFLFLMVMRFFLTVALPVRREIHDKLVYVEFLVIFFCEFFSCHITCANVATYAIFATCW